MLCGPKHRVAFTLVELLVVVAIIALLIAILMPSLGRAKEQTYKVRCLAHLGNLMSAHATYASIYNQHLPGFEGVAERPDPNEPFGIWACTPISTGLVAKANVMTTPEMWLCPKALLPNPGVWYEENNFYPGYYHGPDWTQDQLEQYRYTYHFTYNSRTCFKPKWDRQQWGSPSSDTWVENDMRRIDTFPYPDRTILLAEENTGMMPFDQSHYQILNDPLFHGPDWTEPRHLGTSQAGYLDGHAGSIPSYIELFYNEEYWPVPPDLE